MIFNATFSLFCLLSIWPNLFAQEHLDTKEVTSLFEAVDTNCLAWRQGDVLIRRSVFTDTTDVPEIKGRIEDLEVWTRLIFDYDSQRFLELSVAIYKEEKFGKGLKDDKPLLSVELRGQLYDKTQELTATMARGNSTKGKVHFQKSRIVDERIENDYPVSMDFSDYRFFWFYRSRDTNFVRENLLRCKTGNGYVSHLPSGKNKITIRMGAEDSQVLDGGGIVTHLDFDTERFLLLSNRSVYRKKGQPDAITDEFELKWKLVNDVYVPRESRGMKGKAFYDESQKIVEAGMENTTHHFHWLALNEKLNDDHFRIDNFQNPAWIEKMIDPLFVGAKTLETFRRHNKGNRRTDK
jgi:hypothetical protein